LVFEYIHEDNLGGDNWVENVNARIDTSGFDASWIVGDFTVKGTENNIPTTIHYSDGIDTFIAESDEASATGWAWENNTKVFEGTSPDWYRKVNLCADRQTPTPKLYATAVFYDDSEGTQYVVVKRQSNTLDITGWGNSQDISDNTNTSTIYGESCRSIGESGASKDDVLFVYKEGDAIKSQYFSAGVTKGIQTVDADTYSGKTAFDLEHSIDAGLKVCHLIFIDADGSVKSIARESGNTTAWSGLTTLHGAITPEAWHGDVGIVENGDGVLHYIWKHHYIIEHRLHRHEPVIWVPDLGNDPDEFDPSTDAVINTETVAQIQTPDSVPAYAAIPMIWIGLIGVDPCELGWGLLVGPASKVYSRWDEKTLPTDDDDLETLFISTEYTKVSTSDNQYVDQEGNFYWMFEFKDKNTNNTDKIKVNWEGQSDLAPSTSTVYLQIYNQTDGIWENIDSDNATAANTDFTLSGSQFAQVDKYYKKIGNYYWVSCRVYQQAVYE